MAEFIYQMNLAIKSQVACWWPFPATWDFPT